MRGYDLERWFTRFFDGDGYVKLSISTNEHTPIGYQICPMIQIKHAQLAGSIDAEGCVSLKVQKGKNRIGYSVQPMLEATECDSDRLMAALQTYCEYRGVSCSISLDERDAKRSDQYCWRVGGIKNLQRFLEPIRDAFIVKTEQIAILLDEILPMMVQGLHLHKPGFLEIMDAVDRLNAYKGGNRGEYTLEYFENLWGMKREQQQRLDYYLS